MDKKTKPPEPELDQPQKPDTATLATVDGDPVLTEDDIYDPEDEECPRDASFEE